MKRFGMLAAALLFGAVLIPALMPVLPGRVRHMLGANVQLRSLKTVPVPEPANLTDYVQDKSAAIQLGKALFWDMQVGGDGMTSCASCHFQAGADNRTTNTLNPRGGNPGFVANLTLKPSDFPFHQVIDPTTAAALAGAGGEPAGGAAGATVVSDRSDVVGSQGVMDRSFMDDSGHGPNTAESCKSLPDPVFHVGSASVRQVTGRNAPSNINAVFNRRNFWDGRAQNEFNGVDPFGSRDVNARILKLINGQMQSIGLSIPLASLASQADGPALNGVEMSCAGKSWALLGHKLLAPGIRPLGKQAVDPADSVLGAIAQSATTRDEPGLTQSYEALIKKAFVPAYWSSRSPATVAGDSYSQMEANFSLFFGLAIDLYETTLVANDTPLDQYLDGNTAALTAQQQQGMGLFTGPAKCIACHGGPELTNAGITNVTTERIERMHMANGQIAAYDNGFYNIGVRPAADDPGVGGTDPFGHPLSETALCQQQIRNGQPCQLASGILPRPGEEIPITPLDPNERIAVQGAFKTPGLRNVELTGPYFHNGGKAALRQVIDFYNRGGDFADVNRDNLDPNVKQLNLTEDQKQALVAFLVGLTDERVRWQKAPFDHPALCVPNGASISNGTAADIRMCLPATGAGGGQEPLHPFLRLDPQTGAPGASASATYTVTLLTKHPTWVTVSQPGGANRYVADSDVTLTATPSGNEVFKGWTVDGVDAGSAPTLMLTMNTNHTVVALFGDGPT